MVTMNISNTRNTNSSVTKIHDLMKTLKFLEEDRKESFKNWQYDDEKNCSVENVSFMSS